MLKCSQTVDFVDEHHLIGTQPQAMKSHRWRPTLEMGGRNDPRIDQYGLQEAMFARRLAEGGHGLGDWATNKVKKCNGAANSGTYFGQIMRSYLV